LQFQSSSNFSSSIGIGDGVVVDPNNKFAVSMTETLTVVAVRGAVIAAVIVVVPAVRIPKTAVPQSYKLEREGLLTGLGEGANFREPEEGSSCWCCCDADSGESKLALRGDRSAMRFALLLLLSSSSSAK
jgi:hypothetical protein